jgi:aminomethyltransferase
MVLKPIRTPLYEELKAQGGKFVPFAGYEMPIQFAGIKKEHLAVRERVGIFDVSHMGEIWLTGPDALGFADYLVTNDIAGLDDGQVAYSPMCLETGGIVDDLLVYRLSRERLLLVVNAANRAKDFKHITAHRRGDVEIVDKSADTGQLALQGPRAEALLSALTGDRFKELSYFRFTSGEVAGVSCLVSRTGYTGEDGFELYCDQGDLVALFRAVAAAGEPMGLLPVGLGARDTLRLEAKLSLYGNDIDETTTPLEAGLGWTVKLDGADFIGKGALLAQKKRGVDRRLVGFRMVDKAIARHGYPVVPEGAGPGAEPMAEVCSGGPSPTLKQSIGLVYLQKKLAKKGSRFGVVIREKVKMAEVVKTPFYKRDTPNSERT